MDMGPFYFDVPFLNPLKTSENQRFSDFVSSSLEWTNEISQFFWSVFFSYEQNFTDLRIQ